LANALSQSGMNKPHAEGNVNHNLDLDLEKYFVVKIYLDHNLYNSFISIMSS